MSPENNKHNKSILQRIYYEVPENFGDKDLENHLWLRKATWVSAHMVSIYIAHEMPYISPDANRPKNRLD
jgi:hypothetical protein